LNGNCQQTVVNFIRSQLHLNIQDIDIDIAHQLPVRKLQTTENGSPKTTSSHTPGTTQVQESVVIVTFRYRSIRDDVLRSRRILKGTRLSIHEDLTAVNVQTLNRIWNNPRVSTTLSWNGRLFALLKSS